MTERGNTLTSTNETFVATGKRVPIQARSSQPWFGLIRCVIKYRKGGANRGLKIKDRGSQFRHKLNSYLINYSIEPFGSNE